MRRLISWKSLLKPFRTLGWKLTLSYTLVTVVALLVVELIIIGVALVVVFNSNLLPGFAAQTIVATAPQLVPYMEQQPPDVNGLNSWLMATQGRQIIGTGSGSRTSNSDISGFTKPGSQIFILDPQKVILAALPPSLGSLEGKTFNTVDAPRLGPLVEAALSGEGDYRHLFIVDSHKKLLIAAPIKAEDGKVLGVITLNGTIIEANQSFGQLPGLIGGSLLLFTCAAGVLGTIFGLITARSLTRRLRTVTQAADAWSRGDFSILIQDRSNDELGQMAQRLNRMSQQLENLLHTRQEYATLEERNRLARDLHDSVKQQVFAAAMQVGAARELLPGDPAHAEDRLAQAEQLARQAQQELSTLIRELRPIALEKKGLAKALREYLADWTLQTGVQVDLRLLGERSISLELEETLYRVVQEALSNVTRHSRATSVEVHFAWESNQVALHIADNGHGFDLHEVENKGVGLQSMRERVQAMGGTLSLDSGVNGTRIEAVVPLPNNVE